MGRVVTLLTVVLLNSNTIVFAQQPERINDPELYKLLNAGQTLAQQSKYEEALEKFKLALVRDPHSKGALIDMGGVLVKLGRFEEAQPILIQATKDHPEAPEAWLDLATSYQSTGKITESLDCLRQFLKLAPHHELAPKVHSMIILLQQDQQRRAGMGGNDQGDDYLADAVQSGTIRFAKDRMPVKIYLAPGATVPGFKPEYDEIVRQSFADWQAAAPEHLSFAYVPSAEAADITVTWTNDPTKMVSSAEGGHAEVVPSQNGILKSDITLLTTKPSGGAEVGSNYMKHVVLHEVGHALGIFGHSPKAGDIMYGIVMPTNIVANLSDRDKHTMLALYSATGADVHPMDNSKMFVQGDSSNPAVRLVHLNNEAAQAMSAGKYTEAQTKFEQALKIDPNNFSIKQNLAALYANLGSMAYMKRDFAGAEGYFKKAIPILEKSPDKSNLKLVLRSYSTVLRTSGKAAEAASIDAKLSAVK
jgi:tetratricopeptide (TPR) repeat protein